MGRREGSGLVRGRHGASPPSRVAESERKVRLRLRRARDDGEITLVEETRCQRTNPNKSVFSPSPGNKGTHTTRIR